MTVLGLTGGLDAAHETAYDLPFDFIHDAAAVLVRGGRVEAAVEEERLNRIKHTNKAPQRALRFCLERAGLRPEQLDAVAFYATEPYCQRVLQSIHLAHPEIPELLTPRSMVQRYFRREFGAELPAAKVHFVDHHLAHAISAYAMSGFDAALVVTLDGQGEGVSGAVYEGRGRELKPLRRIPERDSLGYLYRDVIKFLGYEMFDEYKVMGMAPYGDPAKYRALFRTFFELLPEGEYRLHLERVMALFRVARPRRRGGDFTAEHRDIAAALQEATEEIGLHVLGHFRRQTGLGRLCLAGGVAHNCSLNGRILYSGLFEQMMVQPAAHDAGCALGAALTIQLQLDPASGVEPLRHVFWGPEAGSEAEIERELRRWRRLLRIERCPRIVERAAELLAQGQALGWVQGRSEFGPRALGHRSILADPRPAANKDVINAMVKKREAYRPFAPSVLAEAVDKYFVTVPGQKEFPYMSVILKVRPEWRERLGAVTHVDGTARVQTVAREASPRYWELIRTFGAQTGVEMLLNTSFNNHAEPIVDSVRDAVVCFLTTGLQALVVGDWLAAKAEEDPGAWLELRPSLAPAASLTCERRAESAGACRIGFTYHHGRSFPISTGLHEILGAADGKKTLRELGARMELLGEVRELWGQRVIALEPPA